MALSPIAAARRTAVASLTRITPDRRRHKRHTVTLLGRFMRASKQEYPLRLVDVSVGGAAMMSPVDVELGERIVCYIDLLGGIEGSVTRVFDGGFAIQFSISAHKREKLADQLTWLVNRHELTGIEARRHDRIELRNSTSTLRLDEGIEVQVEILDVSLSGASVATPARPEIGAEVLLGKLRARVARHHERGIGLQFLDIQDSEALRRTFSNPS